jgi:carbonic anhydrase
VARTDLLRLLVGFRRFRERYFEQATLFQRLSSNGQSPKTLVIACSDSRVDPALITSASPGDLFVVRNVANLVPPFESTEGFHGVSSAIEFAVNNLRVENILIMGHRQCGGIRALMSAEMGQTEVPGIFVGPWMSLARKAARAARRTLGNDADMDALCKHCEMTSISDSIENLKTFPFVREAMESRGMSLVGAYFDLEQGQLWELEEATQQFRQLEI